MYSLNFNCPSSRTDCSGLAKIQIWVTVNGNRKTVYLSQKADPTTFKKQLNNKTANDVNVFCSNVRQKIDRFMLLNQNATVSDVINFIKDDFNYDCTNKNNNPTKNIFKHMKVNSLLVKRIAVFGYKRCYEIHYNADNGKD